MSSNFTFTMNFITLEPSVQMAYIDTNPSPTSTSPPVVFLHGNPTSSYIWRNIIPHVSPSARCIAPDLIGMGASSKHPASFYGWDNHTKYLSTFLAKILKADEKVILVLHDFGSLFGLNWARENSDRVVGMVLMEFLPVMPTWESTGEMPKELHDALSAGPEALKKSIVEDNIFIEVFLQAQIVRPLTTIELEHYRAPFRTVEDREAIFEMTKFFPVAGQPGNVYAAVEKYHEWLVESEMPKLFFWADPGKIITVAKKEGYERVLRNTEFVGVGEARHFLQEDCPGVIGTNIGRWLGSMGLVGGK